MHYHLPQIVAAPLDQAVFIVEGEKDVERLELENQLATTNPMGAGKWRNEYNAVLTGRPAIILPDNDEPGRRRARRTSHNRYLASPLPSRLSSCRACLSRVMCRTGSTTAAPRGSCGS